MKMRDANILRCLGGAVMAIALPMAMIGCNSRQTSVPVGNGSDSNAEFTSVSLGDGQQIGDVKIMVTDIQSLGKESESFGETQAAEHEWMAISVIIQNLKPQSVRAETLTQTIVLKDSTGKQYNEDIFLSIECENVDIEQLILSEDSVSFCHVFDAPNNPQELYWENLSPNTSTEYRFLMQ